MEISSGLGSLVSGATGGELGVRVLKKALDSQAQVAASLIQAIPQPQTRAANLPPHLGRNIDTTA